jgi:hypothetical protein
MNGCDYLFHLESATLTHRYTIKATVICETGHHITLELFTSALKHAEGKSFCHITITENAAGYTGLDAVDNTNGTGTVTGTVNGITADKKSPTGSILCPEESTTEASLSQDVLIKGMNGGKETAISLS